jgi:hypothetical protein
MEKTIKTLVNALAKEPAKSIQKENVLKKNLAPDVLECSNQFVLKKELPMTTFVIWIVHKTNLLNKEVVKSELMLETLKSMQIILNWKNFSNNMPINEIN